MLGLADPPAAQEAFIMDDRIDVRPLERSDIDEVIRIQHLVYPPERFESVSRWSPRYLAMHREVFPEGQLVVTYDGQVAGHAVTQLVELDRAFAEHSWAELTGRGTLRTHRPDGDALYGVDVCVSPELRGKGLGKALYRARLALARSVGAGRIVAGARIPGYCEHADEMSAARYLDAILSGRQQDPTLSFQLAQGFSPVRLLPSYFPDPESHDWAVLIARPVERAADLVAERRGRLITAPADARAG